MKAGAVPRLSVWIGLEDNKLIKHKDLIKTVLCFLSACREKRVTPAKNKGLYKDFREAWFKHKLN